MYVCLFVCVYVCMFYETFGTRGSNKTKFGGSQIFLKSPEKKTVERRRGDEMVGGVVLKK